MNNYTMSQCRKDHPVFFRNCKSLNRGSMHHVKFVSSMYKSRCFITKETIQFSHGVETKYKVWFVPTNIEHSIKPLLSYSNIHDARDAAKNHKGDK